MRYLSLERVADLWDFYRSVFWESMRCLSLNFSWSFYEDPFRNSTRNKIVIWDSHIWILHDFLLNILQKFLQQIFLEILFLNILTRNASGFSSGNHPGLYPGVVSAILQGFPGNSLEVLFGKCPKSPSGNSAGISSEILQKLLILRIILEISLNGWFFVQDKLESRGYYIIRFWPFHNYPAEVLAGNPTEISSETIPRASFRNPPGILLEISRSSSWNFNFFWCVLWESSWSIFF